MTFTILVVGAFVTVMAQQLAGNPKNEIRLRFQPEIEAKAFNPTHTAAYFPDHRLNKESWHD